MRMCITVPPKDPTGFEMTSYHHVGCFRLPRKYATGATKISPAEFLEDYVTDTTDDNSILPKKLDELAELIANSSAVESSTSTKKRSAPEKGSLIERLSAALEEDQENRPKKKVKKDKGGQDDDWNKMVEIYGRYHKNKLNDIKEVLR